LPVAAPAMDPAARFDRDVGGRAHQLQVPVSQVKDQSSPTAAAHAVRTASNARLRSP
jgi:hypothetical protein